MVKAAISVVVLLAVVLAGQATTAESAFPGANGRIVFQRGAAADVLDGGGGRDSATWDKLDRAVSVEVRPKPKPKK